MYILIRRKEEGGTGRGALARAAAATIRRLCVSVLFLSRLILLYLLAPIQE